MGEAIKIQCPQNEKALQVSWETLILPRGDIGLVFVTKWIFFYFFINIDLQSEDE